MNLLPATVCIDLSFRRPYSKKTGNDAEDNITGRFTGHFVPLVFPAGKKNEMQIMMMMPPKNSNFYAAALAGAVRIVFSIP